MRPAFRWSISKEPQVLLYDRVPWVQAQPHLIGAPSLRGSTGGDGTGPDQVVYLRVVTPDPKPVRSSTSIALSTLPESNNA